MLFLSSAVVILVTFVISMMNKNVTNVSYCKSKLNLHHLGWLYLFQVISDRISRSFPRLKSMRYIKKKFRLTWGININFIVQKKELAMIFKTYRGIKLKFPTFLIKFALGYWIYPIQFWLYCAGKVLNFQSHFIEIQLH